MSLNIYKKLPNKNGMVNKINNFKLNRNISIFFFKKNKLNKTKNINKLTIRIDLDVVI